MELEDFIARAMAADACFHMEDIQSLWSGYGKIMRYGLKGGPCERVVVKHVQFPDQRRHPRGWNTDLSHQRKLRSYEVEGAWYHDWASRCDEHCRVPQCFAQQSLEDEVVMVFEDLDASGFGLRHESLSPAQMGPCLSWLANFHALFMQCEPTGLWETGTYWHLATRPDELAALKDQALKAAATAIDAKLRQGYQTLVHGDAKLANFCFSSNGDVAAVDFQYVGGGCGMKDVAYFIGSCLYESDCERYENQLLDQYFSHLEQALKRHNSEVNFSELQAQWRALYPVAWTDFHRFVKGWSPGHWKIHGYSERLASEVLAQMSAV